jgi:CheY-like chemotaxis protein
VLVVEDDPPVRELACRVLKSHGYGVLSAANGPHALQLAGAHTGPAITLVFTDVIMPQMDGKALAERLRAMRPDLKILFTSGYTEKVIGNHGGLAPGAAFLAKPYNPVLLLNKIRETLDQPSPEERRPEAVCRAQTVCCN